MYQEGNDNLGVVLAAITLSALLYIAFTSFWWGALAIWLVLGVIGVMRRAYKLGTDQKPTLTGAWGVSLAFVLGWMVLPMYFGIGIDWAWKTVSYRRTLGRS